MMALHRAFTPTKREFDSLRSHFNVSPSPGVTNTLAPRFGGGHQFLQS